MHGYDEHKWAAAPPRSGWHKHHIIPLELATHRAFTTMFDNHPGSVVALNDFRRNGMYMPANEYEARAHQLPLHCGPHPRYNRIAIDLFDRSLVSLGPNASLSRISMAIAQLQDRLRNILQIVAVQGDVRLGSRDPFGTSAALAALDRKTEALFNDQCAKRSMAPCRI